MAKFKVDDRVIVKIGAPVKGIVTTVMANGLYVVDGDDNVQYTVKEQHLRKA